MLWQTLARALKRTAATFTRHGENIPSLVMNEMNSLTHSCMHSLASLAILAFSGNAVFMIRATGAKLCMLASLSEVFGLFLEREDGCDGEDCGDCEGIAIRPNNRLQIAGWRMSL